MDNGNAVVDVSGGVSGDLTIETTGDPFSGTTAGGSTSVTILDATASMHAVLPDGAFDHPVGFTISRTFDTPPEAGTAADGSPAQIDPILGYRFAFDIPTLNADANLTFTVDLSQLDAVGRADLLNAIGAGTGTIAVKGDAPDAAFHAFAQCLDPQTPTADGCVAVTLLNAIGAPAGPTENPAFARFEGVAGHFSTYVVARVLALDTTPPAITVPASVTVDATGPKGAPGHLLGVGKGRPRPVAEPRVHAGVGDRVPHRRHDGRVQGDGRGREHGDRPVRRPRPRGERADRPADRQDGRVPRPARAQAGVQGGAPVRGRREPSRGDPRAACQALDVYIAAVQYAPARAFTPAERSELIADARRIKAVIGC